MSYSVVPLQPGHTSAVAALDGRWAAEQSAPWRGAPLDAAAVNALAARSDVAFLVLLVADSSPAGETVAGFAWADFTTDERDITLDSRRNRRLAELHYIYCAAEHRGGVRAPASPMASPHPRPAHCPLHTAHCCSASATG